MSDRPASFAHVDSRGVRWDAFLLFDRYFARSARGEQCEAVDVAGAKIEIERVIRPHGK